MRKDGVKTEYKKKNDVFSLLTDIYVFFVLGIYLLYPGFSGYADITLEKWRLFSTVSVIYIVLMLVIRAELLAVGKSKLPDHKSVAAYFTPTRVCVILFAVFAVISAVLSDHPSVVFDSASRHNGLFAILVYCSLILVASMHLRSKKAYVYVLSVSVSLCCLMAVIQFFGANPLGMYPDGMNYYDAGIKYSGSFLGTIGNTDILSAVLSLSSALFFASLLKFRERSRFFLLLPIALSVAVLVFSRSAGGLFSLVLSFAVIIILQMKTKKARIAAIAAVIIIAMLLLCAVFFFGEHAGGTVFELSQLLHGKFDDSFGSGRIFIWKESAKLIPESLLFGGGPDTLGSRLDAVFERYDRASGLVIRAKIDDAHNEYLGILVDLGALCFATFALCAIIFLIKYFTRAKNTSCAVCGAAVFTYLVWAFFGVASPISLPFFVLAFAAFESAEFERNDEH